MRLNQKTFWGGKWIMAEFLGQALMPLRLIAEVSHEHMPAGAGWEPSKRGFAR
jgi:hypothetical protein